MNNLIDKPKSLRDPQERRSRLVRLGDPHISSLTHFVEKIRKETAFKREIPYFDPLDGGIYAQCLFLFEAPGPGAVDSGFISRDNPDETAKNFFELNQRAGLPRELTISWNVVPWYIGTGSKIRPATQVDIYSGKEYLFLLLSLLPQLKIIVLSGRKAQKVEPFIKECCSSITLLKMPHPSPMFINRSPDNKFQIMESLQYIKAHFVDHDASYMRI
jgi:uracil-DNA glycosylase